MKLSRVRFVHPSLIAGEGHGVFALKGSNLVVEAILSTIKDSDTTLAGILQGRICIDSMTSCCFVGETLGSLNPDVTFNL